MSDKIEEKKYGALRVVATINKILGWIIIIIGVSIPFFTRLGDWSFAVIGGSLLLGLLSLASGQIFYVFMDIEKNTRHIEEIRNFIQTKVAQGTGEPRMANVQASVMVAPDDADAKCPKCDSLITHYATQCWKCKTPLGSGSSLKPVPL